MIRNFFFTALFFAITPLQAHEISRLAVPSTDTSMAPRLIALGQNRALLSWLERRGEEHLFRASVYDGKRFREPFTIAAGGNFFANWADTPGVGVDASGAWYAHWLERSGRGTYAYDVRVAISADRGASWSEPFTPHTDGTLTEHGFVSHYIAADGGIGLVWLDGRLTTPDVLDLPAGRTTAQGAGHGRGHDGGHDGQHSGHHGGEGGPMTLRTAQIDAAGTLQAQAQLDARVCDCCATDAGSTAHGPVVVYRDRSDDEVRDIKLLRQVDGVWSSPVTVHDDGWQIAGCPVNGPALLARDETVIVAWFTLDDEVPVVRIARSHDGGASFAAPKDFDRGDALGRVDLAWTRSGYALLWLAQGDDGGLMRLAHFNRDGKTESLENIIPIDTGRSSGFPQLLQLQDDRLLLAWTNSSARDAGSAVEAALIDLAPAAPARATEP